MASKKVDLTGSVLAAIETVRRTIEFALAVQLDWMSVESVAGKIELQEGNALYGARHTRDVHVTGVLRTISGDHYQVLEASKVRVHNYPALDVAWEPINEVCLLVGFPDCTRIEVHVRWDRPEQGDPPTTYNQQRAIPSNRERGKHLCKLQPTKSLRALIVTPDGAVARFAIPLLNVRGFEVDAAYCVADLEIAMGWLNRYDLIFWGRQFNGRTTDRLIEKVAKDQRFIGVQVAISIMDADLQRKLGCSFEINPWFKAPDLDRLLREITSKRKS